MLHAIIILILVVIICFHIQIIEEMYHPRLDLDSDKHRLILWYDSNEVDGNYKYVRKYRILIGDDEETKP